MLIRIEAQMEVYSGLKPSHKSGRSYAALSQEILSDLTPSTLEKNHSSVSLNS